MSTNNLEAKLLQLKEIRMALLRLHKALLESERTVYEQVNGRIQSSGEFLRLVIGHEWFAWLHPISQFIVQIDELMAAKEPVTLEQADGLFAEAQNLLRPELEGNTQEQRYYHAIQRDPGIAMMHAEVSELLRSNN